MNKAPTKVLVWDPCPFGQPRILTVAHIMAVSISWGFLFVRVLILRVLLLGSIFWPLIFGNSHINLDYKYYEHSRLGSPVPQRNLDSKTGPCRSA